MDLDTPRGSHNSGSRINISGRNSDLRGPWRNLDEVEYATLTWVNWFNHHRLLEPIGDVPPAELEQGYYQQLEESAQAA